MPDRRRSPGGPGGGGGGRRPPRPRESSKDRRGGARGGGGGANDARSASRDHVVRVTVLGLAGVVVNRAPVAAPETIAPAPSRRGRRGNKHKDVAPPPSPSLPDCVPLDPSDLKAVVAFSRNRRVNGISPPSLPLAPSPSNREGDDPERGRYIAVWGSVGEDDDDCSAPRDDRDADDKAAVEDGHSVGGASIASSAFAPKSFEVTVALGDERRVGRAAYTVGVATLAITGEECAREGAARVVDLPVLSLDQARPGVSMGSGKTMRPWYPVIALGNVATDAEEAVEETPVDAAEDSAACDSDAASTNGKKKKRLGLKRLFRKRSTSEKNLNDPVADSAPNPNKRALFVAEEKEAFSRIYGIDSSDAVLRISVEVYEKGSELEWVVRRNRRKTRDGDGNSKTVGSPNSHRSRSSGPRRPDTSIHDSRSVALMEFSDDEDTDDLSHGEDVDDDYYDYDDLDYSSRNRRRRDDGRRDVLVQSKSMLGSFLISCGAPQLAKAVTKECVFPEDQVSEDESNSLYRDRRRRRRRGGQRRGKRRSEKSPRNVADFPLDDDDHDDGDRRRRVDSYESGTATATRDSLTNTNTNTDEYDDDVDADDGGLLRAPSTPSVRRAGADVARALHDVLRCTAPRGARDDNGEAPPSVVVDRDQESIGELTENTYEYDVANPVATSELVPKVAPRIVLAGAGKALSGRVFLPAAFGGDGMCIGTGHKLTTRDDKAMRRTKSGRRVKGLMPAEDYERIFFHEEQSLDPVVAFRTMRPMSPVEQGVEVDEEAHDEHTRRTEASDETPAASEPKGPVSAVYEVNHDEPVLSGEEEHPSPVQATTTTAADDDAIQGILRK